MTQALAESGHREQARVVTKDLLRAADAIPAKSRASSLVDLAEAMADAGLGERAVAVAHQIAETYWRARALVRVAWALARREPGDQAQVAIDQAVEAAREIRNYDGIAWAQARLAAALVKTGRLPQARAATYESLRAASRVGRAAVYDAMPGVAMIFTCQEDDEAADRLIQTVSEVDSWWTER
jgi:tetratricopeptide (TPR) repeat protein